MEARSNRIADTAELYGFGTERMKRLKVCARCGSIAGSDYYVCRQCGARLPRQTLFQLYQRRHRLCPVCDTVLTDNMRYCPHCGARQEQV